ncbi:MAG: hypothetical protein EBV05_11045 [Cyanobacteria bacterium WB6_1B_304]|nr:hypothetical protein [Cyanobacteria bacterium WB6_1B_304]
MVRYALGHQWVASPPSYLAVQAVSEVDTTLNALDPIAAIGVSLTGVIPFEILRNVSFSKKYP